MLQIQQVITVNPEAKQTSTFFYGYIIVIATFIIAVAVEGLLFSFGVFFKPLLSEFGWTRAMTSGAMSLGSVLRIPMSMVSGRLTDKLGSRVMLTACGFFLGLGYLLMSQINALWHLYLFYGGNSCHGHELLLGAINIHNTPVVCQQERIDDGHCCLWDRGRAADISTTG